MPRVWGCSERSCKEWLQRMVKPEYWGLKLFSLGTGERAPHPTPLALELNSWPQEVRAGLVDCLWEDVLRLPTKGQVVEVEGLARLQGGFWVLLGRVYVCMHG